MIQKLLTKLKRIKFTSKYHILIYRQKEKFFFFRYQTKHAKNIRLSLKIIKYTDKQPKNYYYENEISRSHGDGGPKILIQLWSTTHTEGKGKLSLPSIIII